MPLESNFSGPSDLNPTWPETLSDPISEGAAHLRGVKEAIQGAVAGDGTYAALVHDTAEVVTTTATGLEVSDGTTPGGRIDAATGSLQITPSGNSSSVSIRARDGGGVATTGVLVSSAATQLNHGSTLSVVTTAEGAQVQPAAGSSPILAMAAAAGTPQAELRGEALGVELDTLTGQSAILAVQGTPVLSASQTAIDVHNKKIINVAAPTDGTDGASKGYVDSAIGAIPTPVTVFESNQLNISTSGSVAHGLGEIPFLVQAVIRNVVPQNGYVAGDEVIVNTENTGSGTRGITTWVNTTTVGYATNSANQITIVPKAGNAAAFQITDASWRLILRCVKF